MNEINSSYRKGEKGLGNSHFPGVCHMLMSPMYVCVCEAAFSSYSANMHCHPFGPGPQIPKQMEDGNFVIYCRRVARIMVAVGRHF